MSNDLVNPRQIQLLLQSDRWTICGPGADGDGAPLDEPMSNRRRWSRRNVHSHEVLELMLCIEGECIFGLGGELYECQPGTLFVVAGGMEHDCKYSPEAGPAEHLWLRFMGGHAMIAWLSINAGRVGRKFTQFGVAGEANLGISLKAFLSPIINGAPLERSAGARLLAGVITRYFVGRLADTKARQPVHDKADLHGEVIEAICRHILETAGRGVDLEELAYLTGYSKFYLTRVFRREMGCTVHQYIDRIRLTRITDFEAAGATNTEIAETLGFSCPTAYIRWRRRARPHAPRSLSEGLE